MQKWEYWIIEAYDVKGQYRLQSVNDKEVPNWKNSSTTLYEYCTQLGDQGWEIIASTSAGYNHVRLVFKRPKGS